MHSLSPVRHSVLDRAELASIPFVSKLTEL